MTFVLREVTEPLFGWMFWKWRIWMAGVCATGTPGIGKTATTCILIRLLLHLNVTVVYNVRTLHNSKSVFVFTPSNVDNESKYTISVFPQEIVGKTLKKNIYNNESTYYVVDPGITKDNCNRPDSFCGKVIIVASPDEGHWGGSDFDKERDHRNMGKFRYYPVWECTELIMASSILRPSGIHMNESEIVKRFTEFGGVPRYVFTRNYSEIKMKLDTALDDLLFRKYSDLILLKNKSGIKSANKDLPEDILLSHVCDGYATFSSYYIYEYVVDKYMTELWHKIIPNEGTFDPYLYEIYTKKLFYNLVKSKTDRKSTPV